MMTPFADFAVRSNVRDLGSSMRFSSDIQEQSLIDIERQLSENFQERWSVRT
jgi:hypothetical protein